MARQPVTCQNLKRTAHESKIPPVDEWEPFCCIKPGHYWVEQDDTVRNRGDFLQTGRSPRVVLKDIGSVKSLRYTCGKKSGGTEHMGTCVVHALPPNWKEIQAWVNDLDCGLVYRGEGLPSMSYKVLLRLISRKERIYLTGVEKIQSLKHRIIPVPNVGARVPWNSITLARCVLVSETKNFKRSV